MFENHDWTIPVLIIACLFVLLWIRVLRHIDAWRMRCEAATRERILSEERRREDEERRREDNQCGRGSYEVTDVVA
ncbi:MAG TPA: hypothetical protein VGB97_00945 [Candidatus Paceibacterota bacterium]|jgi:hypothetical protein